MSILQSEVEKVIVKLQVFDPCHGKMTDSMAILPAHFSNSHGIILVFDYSDRSSFLSLEKWIAEAKDVANDRCQFLVVGTQAHLPPSPEVSVLEKEASDYSMSNQSKFSQALQTEKQRLKHNLAQYATVRDQHKGKFRVISKQEMQDFLYQMNMIYFDQSMYVDESIDSLSFTINTRQSAAAESAPKKSCGNTNQLVLLKVGNSRQSCAHVFEYIAQAVFNQLTLSIQSDQVPLSGVEKRIIDE